MFNMNKIGSAYLLICTNSKDGENEAIKMAKVIQCEAGGCGKCLTCNQIERMIHPDVIFISPAGMNIKIDQVREVCVDSYIKPYSGNMKVFVFFESDKMTPEAANSFLKTLEEPPGDSVFLLITSNLESILPTIRSRCQKIQIENTDVVNTDVDRLERDKVVKLIEDVSLNEIEKLFSSAKELAKNREYALAALELISTWYREKRNFNMVELIENTKRLLTKNVNTELAMDVLLLKRKL